MDFKRLAAVLLQRLAPIYIAVALSAESTLRRWPWLQRVQTDLAVRERLVTLLCLDSINRQTGLQSYLTAYLQCPPAEIHDVMASIRYDTVAAKLLALIPEPDVPLLPPRRQPQRYLYAPLACRCRWSRLAAGAG